MQSTTSALSAKFFYRKPLLVGEPKPVFGLAPSDPDRPDQESHFKTVKDARGQNHSLSEAGFVLLEHETAVSDFYNDGHVAEIYYPEMQALAQQETGADKVFVMSISPAMKPTRPWASGWVPIDWSTTISRLILKAPLRRCLKILSRRRAALRSTTSGGDLMQTVWMRPSPSVIRDRLPCRSWCRRIFIIMEAVKALRLKSISLVFLNSISGISIRK